MRTELIKILSNMADEPAKAYEELERFIKLYAEEYHVSLMKKINK